ARRGGLRTVAALPAGRAFLSPDYRWLGVLDARDQTTLRLYDTTQEVRPGFSFQVPAGARQLALHPSSETVARRSGDDHQLLPPAGQGLASQPYHRQKKGWSDEEFLFSPRGENLWFAYTDPEGAGPLLLLRCPTLEVLDSCPP